MKARLRERKPHLILDREALDAAHSLSDSELAKKLRVSEATLARLTSGRISPSAAFVARVKVAFPDADLTAIFVSSKGAA